MIRTVELGEEMQESESAQVHIKWSHVGELRRFHLAEHEWNFTKLVERIRTLLPSFNDSLCYSDEDGDKIVFSTNSEMNEMLSHFKKLRVATIKIETLKKSPKDTDNATTQLSPVQNAVPTAQAPKILHPNILCDQCGMQVMGIRYKCLTCDDYDLCELCEKSGMHAEHPMLRLANPDTPKMYELFHRSGRHHHYQLRHQLREQRQEARRSCGGKGTPLTNKMLTKMMERRYRPIDLHTTSTGSRPSANALQPAPAASVNISKPNSQYNLYPSLAEENREFPPQPEHVPGANHRFQERINFLKGIGTQIQESLLNFGVECEATVEDNRGRVHGWVPMPNGRRTPPGPSHSFRPHTEKKNGEQHKSSKRRIDEEEVLVKKLNKCTMESQNSGAKECGEQPKKSRTEDEEKAAQEVAEQTVHESLSVAIQVATTETIQKASQVALEALSAATEIIGSLDQQAGQSTNKIGKDVLESVINGVESLSTSITPIIANIVEKCKTVSATPSPNSTTPAEPAENQTSQAGPSKVYPYKSSNDMIDDLVAYIASLNAKPAETAIVIDQEHEIEIKDQANPNPTPMEVEQLVNFDSDVEVIQNNSTSQSLPAANAQVNVTLSSVSSCSGDSGENQCQMDSDDDWMLVSKSSYKQLCDFYEQKRRQQELEEKEEKEGAEQAMKPESSLSILQELAAKRSGQCYIEATMPALSSKAIPLPYFGTVPSAPASETVTEPAVHLFSSDHSSANKVYPSVEKEPEKCYAGMPFYTIQKPHNKKCYVRHKDLVVQGAVDQLEAMGYDNCNGWLTRLSERFHGDIPSVLDAALQDPLYLVRMTD